AQRLPDEDLRPPDIFQNLAVNLTVAEARQIQRPEGNLQEIADLPGERWMGVPCEKLQGAVRLRFTRLHGLPDPLHASPPLGPAFPGKVGWGGRIRTSGCWIQSPVS